MSSKAKLTVQIVRRNNDRIDVLIMRRGEGAVQCTPKTLQDLERIFLLVTPENMRKKPSASKADKTIKNQPQAPSEIPKDKVDRGPNFNYWVKLSDPGVLPEKWVGPHLSGIRVCPVSDPTPRATWKDVFLRWLGGGKKARHLAACASTVPAECCQCRTAACAASPSQAPA